MAEDTITAAGTELAISAGVPVTLDAAGYAALSYTPIGEVTDAGEGYDREYNPVEYSPLATRRVQVRKGSYSSGTASIVMARSPSDAGQTLLKTASKSDDQYSFRLTYQDGSIDYFRALVMGAPKQIGTIDNIVMISTDLTLQSDVVEVAAP